MIRPLAPDDADAVVGLAVDSGLFPAGEVEPVVALLADYVEGRAPGHRGDVDHDGGELVAMAYYQPAAATDRTWYLTMIAVRAGRQGEGRGSALLAHVEEQLRARGQRMLLVETSGLATFEPTRAFYQRAGYHQEARVRDFFEPGDDMVLFRKVIT